MKQPPIQITTGETTENAVERALSSVGLTVIKPIPDVGIDFNVSLPTSDSPVVKVQVKGRGSTQSNRKYRWFQIRTTPAQRKQAESSGIPLADIWKTKVDKCDFFILVSQHHNEFWVLPKSEVIKIGIANRTKYGNRADNCSGKQSELDLDIQVNGIPLTKTYEKYCNAFKLIMDELNKRQAEQEKCSLKNAPHF